jgi:glycine betaine/proline transport system substrate-binding protein
MKGSSRRRKLLALIVALMAAALVAGCGGGGSAQNKQLTIGNIGWDENVAVSNLTKVLLEKDLGYSNVQLKTADVGVLFQGVGSGDLAAFQDVWMPNHKDYLAKVKNDVQQLHPWYKGTTKFSMAVPTYVKTHDGKPVTSIDQLNQTDATEILGIEPGAVIMQYIPKYVIPEYGLKQKLIQSSTAGMLAEVDKRYKAKEPFVFIAWSPHWMNQKYDFNYLADPKHGLKDLTNPSQISTIVNKDLPNNDKVAYAFMNALTMTESQVNQLEQVIQNNGGDPIKGCNAWLKDNRDVVQPWVDAAKRAQGG